MAVVAVVLYHSGIGGFGGGYVGVDVFFVLSGFLITGLLWRELVEQGRLSFAAFYGRRARRILPAALLVVAVTTVAAARCLPPLQMRGILNDAIASVLYVPNYRFAVQSTNYLAASTAPSPLQHYWSLGVEEQFYLLWPALLLALSRVRSRSRAPTWVGTAAWLSALGAGSFALSVWWTRASQPWAFFSLPTRAWELIAGGVVALSTPWLKERGKAGSAGAGWVALGWAGLGAIAFSVNRFSASTPFPGTAAVIPVAGTAAVLVAGTVGHPWGPVALCGRLLFQVVGKLSYTWYLWHWPVLVLAAAVVGRPLTAWEAAVLALASLALAVLTVALVELPLRFSPWLTHSAVRGRNAVMGAGFTAASVCVLGLVAVSLPSLSGQGTAPTAHPPSPAVAPSAATSGRAAGDQRIEAASAATAVVNQAVAASVSDHQVPANLEPSLLGANRDEPPVFVDGCLDDYTDRTVRPCVFGDTTGTTTVFLVGDSHAAMWFPALAELATSRRWRLVVAAKSTCPPLQITVRSPVLGRRYTECDAWRTRVINRIRAERPALVVLGVARHYSTAYGFSVYSSQWLQGLAGMVTTLGQVGSQVLVLGPIPKPPASVPACLSAHLHGAADCSPIKSSTPAGWRRNKRRPSRRGAPTSIPGPGSAPPRPVPPWSTTSSSGATTITSPPVTPPGWPRPWAPRSTSPPAAPNSCPASRPVLPDRP